MCNVTQLAKKVYLPHPDQVIPKMQVAPWLKSIDSEGGDYYSGLEVRGYVIINKPGKLFTAHVQIQTKHVQSGRHFTVEGWAIPRILSHAFERLGAEPEVWEHGEKFVGYKPSLVTKEKDWELYEVTIRLLEL